MNDYKKMIIKMLDKISDENALKRIYNFICKLYCKGGFIDKLYQHRIELAQV